MPCKLCAQVRNGSHSVECDYLCGLAARLCVSWLVCGLLVHLCVIVSSMRLLRCVVLCAFFLLCQFALRAGVGAGAVAGGRLCLCLLYTSDPADE